MGSVLVIKDVVYRLDDKCLSPSYVNLREVMVNNYSKTTFLWAADLLRSLIRCWLEAVFECSGDEGGAHRVGRAAAIEPEPGRKFSHHAIDGIRVHRPANILALAVGTQRLEQRAVPIIAVPGERQIGAQPRCGPRVD